MFKIAVFTSGNGTNLQAIIDTIKCGALKDVEISTIVSSSAGAYALERAAQNGIPSAVFAKKGYESQQQRDEDIISYLDGFGIDLIVLAGCLIIFSELFITRYTNKIINIHPALIPSFSGKGYYGLKVHEAVLNKGCKITGATVHFVNEQTDEGPIILQKAVEITDSDTPETLQRRVMEQAEWILLPEAIGLIARDELIIENNIVRRKAGALL